MSKGNLIDQDVVDDFIHRGKDSRRNLERGIKQLFEQGRVPPSGWSELWIRHFLHELSLMDSNNFHNQTNGAERDGRIQSRLVAQRHFFLRHGIGKTGDITGVHPKAAGSSLLAKLANSFAFDVLKMQGVKSASACILMPIEMSMALVITLLTLKQTRPKARYVIWPRIDQKSCFIPISTSGLEPVIVESVIDGDNLVTDVSKIKSVVGNLGRDHILCVLSSTSCFAPRLPDKLQDIACICEANDIPHIINNSYGVQSLKCMHLIEKASEIGRVDAFLQSTEKNFLLPVGGSIIAGFQQEFVQSVGRMYPGRASSSPVIDFVITMLSLGDSGYNDQLKRRKELYYDLKKGLTKIGKKYGERCLENIHNELSLALTLKRSVVKKDGGRRSVSEFGSYIFKGYLPTAKVVTPHESKSIEKFTFKGWGMHQSNYPFSYLTVAVTLGVTKNDVERFLKKLDRAFEIFTEDSVGDANKATESSSMNFDSMDSSSDISTANSPRLSQTSISDGTTNIKAKKDRLNAARKPVRRPSKCQTTSLNGSNESSLKSSKSLTRRVEVVKRPELRSSKSLTEKDRKTVTVTSFEGSSKITAEKSSASAPKNSKNDSQASANNLLEIPKQKIGQNNKTLQKNSFTSNPQSERKRTQNQPVTSFMTKENTEATPRGRDKRLSTDSSGTTVSSSSNTPSRSSSILSYTGSVEVGKGRHLRSTSDTQSDKMTFIVDL